jgi:hypothetical protein
VIPWKATQAAKNSATQRASCPKYNSMAYKSRKHLDNIILVQFINSLPTWEQYTVRLIKAAAGNKCTIILAK